jgi:hypothetical protein
MVATNIGGSDNASALAIQSKGKILLADRSDVNGTADFAIARYLP